MELQQLRSFEAVARLGHVTRAAAELHLAQPSLSRQIQVLESELGVALFDRIGRRLELTDAGKLLLPYAHRILRELANARRTLRERADLTTGRVSIGVPPTVGTHLLPRAIAEWNTSYQGIAIELHEAGTGTLLSLLEQGQVDLAVVSLPVAHVAYAELFTEELVIAVADSHILAGKPDLLPADLAAEQFILFPEGYELRDRLLAWCRTVGIEPRIVLDGGEMDTVLRCTAVGLGVSMVPRLALAGAEGLTGLPIRDAHLTRTLGLIWHLARQLSPAAAVLQQFLIDRFQETRR
ncbi:MAG: LysR family transcriptional regulator [Herpetosiphon sp.]